ncbi:hypothetical protein CUT44_10750 [Streptomyces carminius]|uniref:Uncharacterized protein n=1 Tax=Streptomyces carminius TaxID=2665496 RepID=A0A2M8M084_9ACTN|nr:hypothetical protein [Streptomyces carminius]PJE97617.1 hypothetical protein CUT44_10750 [Streptomyces carminius]
MRDRRGREPFPILPAESPRPAPHPAHRGTATDRHRPSGRAGGRNGPYTSACGAFSSGSSRPLQPHPRAVTWHGYRPGHPDPADHRTVPERSPVLTKVKRRAAALAALTTASTVLLAGLATPANAAGGGLNLCNESAHPISAEFPLRSFGTFPVSPGTCHKTSLSNGRPNEQVVIYVHHSGGHKLAVEHFFYDSRVWTGRVIR